MQCYFNVSIMIHAYHNERPSNLFFKLKYEVCRSNQYVSMIGAAKSSMIIICWRWIATIIETMHKSCRMKFFYFSESSIHFIFLHLVIDSNFYFEIFPLIFSCLRPTRDYVLNLIFFTKNQRRKASLIWGSRKILDFKTKRK